MTRKQGVSPTSQLKKRKRRAVALILLIILSASLFSGTTVAGPPRAPGSPSPRIPVILVHGLASSASHAWGAPGAAPREKESSDSGLYQFLVNNGYQPGKTLFAVDYQSENNGDYAVIYRRWLMQAIDQAKKASGSGQVDIVAHSMGSLVARYYLNTPYYRNDVRTLVMIAPPNHGSFGANILKLMLYLERGLRETHQASSTPADRGWGEKAPSTGDVSSDIPPFTGQYEYVFERAQTVYEPLYGEYVLREKLLPSPFSSPLRKPARFEEWLISNHPQLYLRAFKEGQVPPQNPGYTQDPRGPAQPPPPGEALTRAYYETVALHVGRNNFLRSFGLTQTALALGVQSLQPGPGVLETILLTAKEIAEASVKNLAGNLLYRLGLNLAVRKVEDLLRVKPDSVAVDRLLEEYIEFNQRVDEKGRLDVERLLGNYFLWYWNQTETAARTSIQETPRLAPRNNNVKYVVIAGEILNLWAPVYNQVEANDIIVETSSTFLPLMENDVFQLYTGLVTMNHLWLKRNPHVHRFIYQQLSQYYPIASVHSPRVKEGLLGGNWSVRGKGKARLWAPFYVAFTADNLQDASGRLTLRVFLGRTPKEDVIPRVWVLKERTAGGTEKEVLAPGTAVPGITSSVSGRSRGGRQELVVTIPGFGKEYRRVLLGVRTQAPGLTGFTIHQYLPLAPLPFSYSASFEPVSAQPLQEQAATSPSTPSHPPRGHRSTSTGQPGSGLPVDVSLYPVWLQPVLALAQDPQGHNPDSQPGKPAREARTGQAGASPSKRGKTAANETSETKGLGEENQAVPLIRVVRTSKHTTLKKERRTYHVRWEWDLGDGRTFIDPDPRHTTTRVTHTYRRPGTYHATATSYSNDGRILRQKTWTVHVPAPTPGKPLEPVTKTFTLTTIIEPTVQIRIEGPRTWITGRPARFRVTAQVSKPPYTHNQQVKFYPAQVFDVVWARAGTFRVIAAVNVRQSYRFPERSVFVSNIYVKEIPVEVVTTGVTE